MILRHCARLGLVGLLAGVGAGAAADGPADPLPFAVGGDFALLDQTGAPRTQAAPDGQAQLLFFGYANCQEICSAVLPAMAEIADLLAAQGHSLTPVMITVDPARDTVEALGPALRVHHPAFVGLTGSEAALQVAYDAYGIAREELFFDPHYGPVYAHGSFLYLLDDLGVVQTLIPPILPPEQAAQIVASYLDPAS